MQPGIVVSSGLHAALLGVMLVGIWSPKPFETGITESMPVDLVTPEEYDRLTKGSKTSKELDKPRIRAASLSDAEAEDKPEIKEAKHEVKAPPPPAEQAKPEAVEPVPPPIPVKAEIEPPKEPEKPKAPEPKVEPKPEPTPVAAKAPEPKPEPKVEPKPEPKKAEAKPVPTPPRKAPPPPKVEPPKQAQPKPPERTFDSDRIAALLDKREPVRTASAAREIAATSTAGSPRGTATRLSISQRSAIDSAVREQITPCWNPPIGAAGAEEMRVTVRFQLNADGSISGGPSVVDWGSASGFQAAADSALRAVRRCSPLRLPSDAYEYWRDVQITFDPRDMLGG